MLWLAAGGGAVMSPRRARGHRRDPATENFRRGLALLGDPPLFGPLLLRASVARSEGGRCPADGWAVVTTNGRIDAHPTRRGEPEEWLYVLAHCLLHLGFGHLALLDLGAQLSIGFLQVARSCFDAALECAFDPHPA